MRFVCFELLISVGGVKNTLIKVWAIRGTNQIGWSNLNLDFGFFGQLIANYDIANQNDTISMALIMSII